MRSIDEILAEARTKNFDKPIAVEHPTQVPYTPAPEVVKPTKVKRTEPNVAKSHKLPKLSKRGLLLLLVLALSAFSVFGALAFFGITAKNLPTPPPAPLPPPSMGKEALSMSTYSFTNSTEVVLQINQAGSATTTLRSYEVKNSAGTIYTSTNWNGPTLTSGETATVTIDIGQTTFVFTPGNSYNLDIGTAQGNHFIFTVIR